MGLCGQNISEECLFARRNDVMSKAEREEPCLAQKGTCRDRGLRFRGFTKSHHMCIRQRLLPAYLPVVLNTWNSCHSLLNGIDE